MNRSTPEERRWESGLRQGAGASDISGLMASPIIRRTAGVRRSPIETRTTSKNFNTSAPLAATAALQAYLSSEIDTKSKIPSTRPATRLTGNEVPRSIAPPEGRRLSSVPMTRHESAKPASVRLPVDAKANTDAALNGVVDPRPASPLSRLQKHIKQTRSMPGRESVQHLSAEISCRRSSSPLEAHRKFTIAAIYSASEPSSQTLTRSLMDKIQEAKRLRQVENSAGDCHDLSVQARCLHFMDGRFQELSCANLPSSTIQPNLKMSPAQVHPSVTQSGASVGVSRFVPPVPHAKPVKPTIPLLPRSPLSENLLTGHHNDNELDEKLDEKPAKEQEQPTTAALSSINDVSMATNAALAIQGIWRRKRLLVQSRRRNNRCDEADRHSLTQVTLIIDNSCEAVTPLFSAVKRRTQKLAAQQQQESDTSMLNDECDGTNSSILQDDDSNSAGHPFGGDTSYHPWTDHELVFLEEGRCVGELHESVRKGAFMDQDELVWKRPQQIIQQFETQRVASVRKARSSRSLSRQSKPQVTFTTDGKTNELDSSVIDTSVMISPNPNNMCFPSRGNPTTRKRKLRRAHLFKHRDINKMLMVCVARGLPSSKTLKLLVRVQRGDHLGRKIGNVVSSWKNADEEAYNDVLPQTHQTSANMQCSESTVQQACSPSSDLDGDEAQTDGTFHRNRPAEAGSDPADTFDRFVVFTDSGSEVDINHSRNDLITVGDLAQARSPQRDECQNRPANVVFERHSDVIPLTLSSLATKHSEQNEVLLDEAVPIKREALITNSCGISDASAGAGGGFCDVQQVDLVFEEREAFVHCQSTQSWEELLEEMEGEQSCISDGAMLSSCAPSSCSENNAPSKNNALSGFDEAAQESSSRSTDPIRALSVMKSTVTKTMARIHTEYRDDSALDEQDAPCNQQIEELGPATPATRPRLAEDKRIEFLRVLDDFKRCLQSPSSSLCCSSSTTSVPSPASPSWKDEVTAMTSNQVDTVTVDDVDDKGNYDSDL